MNNTDTKKRILITISILLVLVILLFVILYVVFNNKKKSSYRLEDYSNEISSLAKESKTIDIIDFDNKFDKIDFSNINCNENSFNIDGHTINYACKVSEDEEVGTTIAGRIDNKYTFEIYEDECGKEEFYVNENYLINYNTMCSNGDAYFRIKNINDEIIYTSPSNVFAYDINNKDIYLNPYIKNNSIYFITTKSRTKNDTCMLNKLNISGNNMSSTIVEEFVCDLQVE